MNVSEFFKDWTKQQIMLGIGLIVGILITSLMYLFVTDYEESKTQTIEQGTEEVMNRIVTYQETNITNETRINEHLRVASEDTMLTDNLAFREEFNALQQTMMTLAVNPEEVDVSAEVIEATDQDTIVNSTGAIVYLDNHTLESGTVYYMGPVTQKYAFTYNEGRIQSMELIGELNTQQVRILEE